MNLQIVTRTEFNKLCVSRKPKKFAVNMNDIEIIILRFMANDIFIMEINLTDEEKENFKSVEQAFRNYMIDHKIRGGVLVRKGRLFLRNDTVPLVDAEEYNGNVVRMSYRQRILRGDI